MSNFRTIISCKCPSCNREADIDREDAGRTSFGLECDCRDTMQIVRMAGIERPKKETKQ